MQLYVYKIVRDFGFAPNPFSGWCSLATCKPLIRKGAQRGDWVAALAGAKSPCAGKLVYAMQVQEAMGFDEYWRDPRFLGKRPVLNGSLKQLYGDNIYHRDEEGAWVQAESHHSLEDAENPSNLATDTSVDRVLLSQEFVYFGSAAPAIPSSLCPLKETGEDLSDVKRGHRIYRGPMVQAFIGWLGQLRAQGSWGLVGFPQEFENAKEVG